jgi:hypothetical protein
MEILGIVNGKIIIIEQLQDEYIVEIVDDARTIICKSLVEAIKALHLNQVSKLSE